MQIKLTESTFLKKYIINSSELRPEDKLNLPAGKELLVESSGLIDRGHIKVTLVLNGITYKDYFIFARHLVIIKNLPVSPDTSNHVNAAGLDLIKSYEALRLVSYADPGSGGIPYTVGYGHTGPEINRAGIRITPAEAMEYFKKDVAKFEKIVHDSVQVPLTDNEFAALVSFTYNCGAGNLRKSSALKLINRNEKEAGFKALLSWNRANGRVMNGLTRRRQAEIALAGY